MFERERWNYRTESAQYVSQSRPFPARFRVTNNSDFTYLSLKPNESAIVDVVYKSPQSLHLNTEKGPETFTIVYYL